MAKPTWPDYVALFDRPTYLLDDMIGMRQAYREETGNAAFAPEIHEFCECEVGAGELVLVVPYSLGAEARRLRSFHEMFDTEDSHRVAPQELGVPHIDMSARPPPLPADPLEIVSTAAVRACREQAVPG